jgi:hypothetical protein
MMMMMVCLVTRAKKRRASPTRMCSADHCKSAVVAVSVWWCVCGIEAGGMMVEGSNFGLSGFVVVEPLLRLCFFHFV